MAITVGYVFYITPQRSVPVKVELDLMALISMARYQFRSFDL